MRNSAVLLVASVLAAIAPAASHAQQKSQNSIFSAKGSGEANITEARVDPGRAHRRRRASASGRSCSDGSHRYE